jgi:hypothetical protein
VSETAAGALALAAAAYLAAGVLVGIPFVVTGITKVDAAARGTRWPFRALVLPGCIALWPLVARRWLAARRAP